MRDYGGGNREDRGDYPPDDLSKLFRVVKASWGFCGARVAPYRRRVGADSECVGEGRER